MRVGVPREIKDGERRVAITPSGVQELVRAGHRVYVENCAGDGSLISNDDYVAAGAQVLSSAAEVWAEAELVLKVKEPVAEEYGLLRRGQVLFTYLHLAASLELTQALMQSGCTAVAYETVQARDGSLPLLAPMSEVAGRIATQVGAQYIAGSEGRGLLIGGVPGVRAARVVVLGAGVAGMSAVTIALGMGAEVLVLDRDVAKLRAASHLYGNRLQTAAANAYEIEAACLEADIVIGAVLIPGGRAPRIVSEELISRMKPGSVLVDISVDQGGCFEPTRPTTHSNPTYQVHRSTLYCVANIPGAVPRTSTYALTNVTVPYAVQLASLGLREATRQEAALARGVNVHEGVVTNLQIAEAHGLTYGDPVDVLVA